MHQKYIYKLIPVIVPQLSNFFPLAPSQTTMIYCIAPFSILCIIFNICFFCHYPKARQPPFDILLFVTIFSVLNIAVYLSTNIYNTIQPINYNQSTVPPSFDTFCRVTGFIHFTAQLGVTIYNTIFCFYYTFKIKNPLKSWVNQTKQIHLLCFVSITIFAIVMVICDQIGVSVKGICGLKIALSSIFIYFSLFSVCFLMLATSSIIFLRYLHNIIQSNTKIRMFFKYFLIYSFLLSSVYLVKWILTMVLIANCYIPMTETTVLSVSFVGNLSIMVTPIIITFIICFHPEFRQKIIQKLSNYCAGRRILNQQPSTLRNTYCNTLLPQINDNRNQILIELQSFKSNQQGYLSTCKQMNRFTLISTVLGCLSLMNYQKKNRLYYSNSPTTEQNISSWNFTDKYQIIIDDSIINQNKQHFIQYQTKNTLKFIAYSLTLFDTIMQHDNIPSIENSTNPHNNITKIKQNIHINGGKSGQFFYFTYDNRILLKTITQNQLNVLLSRLQKYYYYLKNNPSSLIVKIYGIYTVINTSTYQQYHFMLMTNLCEDINNKYLLRIYDCKGSTHQRQVFKQDEQPSQADYTKKTMKDIDFERLQNKIWVTPQIGQHLKKILKTDSQFFCSNGLIDYSLLIIKIDYNSYLHAPTTHHPTFNPRTMFLSQKQPHIAYILGIIDYLQTWNVKKMSQRFYKSFFTKKTSISSQGPNYYSKRFCQNLIDKIFQ